MLTGINMLCFAASYAIALGLEVLGLWSRVLAAAGGAVDGGLGGDRRAYVVSGAARGRDADGTAGQPSRLVHPGRLGTGGDLLGGKILLSQIVNGAFSAAGGPGADRRFALCYDRGRWRPFKHPGFGDASTDCF